MTEVKENDKEKKVTQKPCPFLHGRRVHTQQKQRA